MHKCCVEGCPNPGAVWVNASIMWCVAHYWERALRKEAELIAEGVWRSHRPGPKPKETGNGEEG